MKITALIWGWALFTGLSAGIATIYCLGRLTWLQVL